MSSEQSTGVAASEIKVGDMIEMFDLWHRTLRAEVAYINHSRSGQTIHFRSYGLHWRTRRAATKVRVYR